MEGGVAGRAPGDGACIVFADSPYRDFAPIRWAVIETVDDTDAKVHLSVRVGAFVLGAEHLTTTWAADADADFAAGRKDVNKTRPYFLFSEPNPRLRNPSGWDEEQQAWADAAARLSSSGFFTGARFARVVETNTTNGLPITDPNTVQSGQGLVATLQLAGADEPANIVVESTPPGWASAAGPFEIRDGHAYVPFVINGESNGSVRFNLMPDPVRSSRPTIALATAIERRTSTAQTNTTAVDSGGVRRLIATLERTATFSTAQWIDLYEDHLLPLGGHDDELLSLFAELTYRNSDWQRAYDAAAKIGEPSPRIELLRFASAARLGRVDDDTDTLDRIDLDDAGSLELLIAALAGSPPRIVHQIAPKLWSDYLGADRIVDLVTGVWNQISDARIATEAASQVAYASDVELGQSLIMKRWPTPATMAPDTLKALIDDLGANNEHAAPYVEHWIRHLASHNNWDALVGLAERVRKLPVNTQPSLMSAIATELMTSGDTAADNRGFGLICEALRVACQSGALETATAFADAVSGAAIEVPGRMDMAQPLLDRLDALLGDSDSLADWRAMQRDRQTAAIGRAFVNKTLRLVGDIDRPWEAALGETFGLKRVVRHPSEKHKSPNTDWLSAVDRDEDIVLIVYGRIGHALSIPVTNHCRMASITHTFAELGERGVIAALAQLASATTR